VTGRFRGGFEGRDVTREHDDGDAPFAHSVLHGRLQNAWHLLRIEDHLAVVAALAEELFGVGLLEVADADFGVQSRSALAVIAPFGSLWTRTVQGRQQTSQSCTSTYSPGSKSAGSISTPPGSPQNGHSTWKTIASA